MIARLRQLMTPRRLLSSAASLAVLLGTLALVDLTYQQLNQPLTDIAVEGELRQHTLSDLETVTADVVGQGFFDLDVAELHRQVESRPWVYRATVRRDWPNRLYIYVREQVPVARWGDDGLLNGEGSLFLAPLKTRSLDLPLLIGPEGTESMVLERYRSLRATAQDAGLDISSVALDDRHAWSVWLEQGLLIDVGRVSPELRLNRLMRIFAPQIRRRGQEMERVDLRYTNGFVVLWRDPEASGKAPSAETPRVG